jgi:hypothetical protein
LVIKIALVFVHIKNYNAAFYADWVS